MDSAGIRRIPFVTALLTGVGALLTSFVSYLIMLSGVDSMVRSLIASDPVGWPFGARPDPLMLAATAVALLLIVGLTWLFVRLVVRGAMPGRGAAVFFGTWGAVIIAGWISGLVRAPLMLAAFRLPAEYFANYAPQLVYFTSAGALWALTWGWIVALVATLIHRSARPVGAPAYAAPSYGTAYPSGVAAPYADPAAPTYPPAPPTA